MTAKRTFIPLVASPTSVIPRISEKKIQRGIELLEEIIELKDRQEDLIGEIVGDEVIMQEFLNDESMKDFSLLPFLPCLELTLVTDEIKKKKNELDQIYW